MKPALLILAAGMGSRYGGLKQIDGIGPNEEPIIEYSIYDAIQSGFGKIVFVIRQEFDEAFRSHFSKFESMIEIAYAYQPVQVELEGVDLVERQKPWGTSHAVLVAKECINEPFAVILPDDLCLNPENSVLNQMVKLHNLFPEYCIVAVEEVDKSEVSQYGIVEIEKKRRNKTNF